MTDIRTAVRKVMCKKNTVRKRSNKRAIRNKRSNRKVVRNKRVVRRSLNRGLNRGLKRKTVGPQPFMSSTLRSPSSKSSSDDSSSDDSSSDEDGSKHIMFNDKLHTSYHIPKKGSLNRSLKRKTDGPQPFMLRALRFPSAKSSSDDSSSDEDGSISYRIPEEGHTINGDEDEFM
jgi:hypothetical protein